MRSPISSVITGLCWLAVLATAPAQSAFGQTNSPPDDPQGRAQAAQVEQAAEPQTRAEQLRREREQKSQHLEPYVPNPLERGIDVAENRVVPLLQRDGIYAKFGSLTTGSGFAYGGGYRDRSLVGGLGSLDLWAAGSFRKYWALEGRLRYPVTRAERLFVEGYGRRHGYPSEEFFGIGPDTRRRDRSIYELRSWITGALVDLEANDELSLAAGVEGLWPTLRTDDDDDDDEFDDDEPTVDQLLGPVAAQAQLASHAVTRTFARVTYDYREPLNARRGGFYEFQVSRYADRRGGAFDFTRAALDLRQYVSVLAERRVFAGRFWVSTTDTPAGSTIPFFLLPALGGNDTLRGFRAYRFRGRHALLLQGEYRWEVWSGLEGALFVDAGKVAMRREDLNFRDLERNYGFGFRFNTDTGVIMRVDAAFGSRDGRHLHVVLGGIF